jgi:hypothetical protein
MPASGLVRAMKSKLQARPDIRRIQIPQLWMKGLSVNFDETIQLQVLKLKATNAGRGAILEHIIENSDVPVLRQMCAKVSHVMYDDLEQVCNLLDMSKREFIETAVSDALERAHEVINRSGVIEQMTLKG